MVETRQNDARVFLEHVFNSSADGIIVTDALGTITMVNAAASNMFGYRQDELLGKNTLELRRPGKEYEIEGTQLIETLLQQGFITGIQRTWHAKDGGIIDVELNAALFRDQEGNLEGAVGVIRDITDRKAIEKKLLDYQQQLKTLALQLIATEERDRRSFAEYLHDNIAQKLFVLKIKMEMIRNECAAPADKLLDEVMLLTEQLISDTRSLTFEMSPPLLYQLGFKAALEWLIEQVHDQYGVTTTLIDDDSPKPLHTETLPVVYRAARELLTNIVKHAGTKNAAIILETKGGYASITVEDGGVGFVPAQVLIHNGTPAGFGLFSIRERIAYIGGQCIIESEPGKGTKVTLLVPLNNT